MTGGKASAGARALVWLVRGYQQHLSPLKPPVCRFIPSCSEYMVQAVVRYGALRGTWMGLVRLGKCGPWHPGGHDPVPEIGDRGPSAGEGRSADGAEESG